MKIDYKKPDCELLHLEESGVLCFSGEGQIDPLNPGAPVTDSDYEQIY